MKKIKYFIFILGVCLLSLGTVNAAKFNVTTNKSTVVVGSNVKITVAVSGTDAAGWEYCLNYDSSLFTLTSHSSTCVLGGTLAGNKSVTFIFKSKKSGSYTFSLRDASILDDSANEVLKSSGKVTVKSKTQAEIEASYSTNANLSALRVVDYVISPEFGKDTLEYNLEVENDVENITIKATKADSAATISGTGEKELSEGLNKFNIVVTAEKGNKKTYVINVTRKELNPIHIDIDGFDYTVVRKGDVLEAPTYYSSTEIELNGEMIPAFSSDITGYTLVGLKDEEGNIDLYRYCEEGCEVDYVLYKQLSNDGFNFIPIEIDKTLSGYEKSKNITINNENIKVYVDDSDSDYVLVYGMNAANGKKSWYMFDTIEGTFQRYKDKTLIEKEESNDNLFALLTIIFSGLSFLTIIFVIVLVINNSKIKKKNDKLISMLQMLRGANKKKEEHDSVSEVKEKKEDFRKRQEEFLETTENEIVEDDVELEETTPVKKVKRGRKKKEN